MRSRLIQALILLALASCGASEPTSAQSNGQGPAPQGASGRPFTLAEVMQFSTPWAMDFLPGGSDALVTEREGKLWLIDVATGARQRVGGIPQVKVAGQGGLGDVVLHPNFSTNHRVYLSFAEAGPRDTSGAAVGYGTLVLGSEGPRIDGFKVIWSQVPKVTGNGHFSHRIVFAPDGAMFVSSGERQKFDPAQDMTMNLGKILHLTDEGLAAPGNPWASRGGIAATYWTMGHRNVLGIAFAPDGRLWASEMGPRGGDEVNLIVPGKNYGWPLVSYGSHYDGRDIPDDHKARGFEEPKVWWNPSISPGSLLIYSGDKFPGWKGDALIGALSGQALIRVDIDGGKAKKADQWDMGARIRAVDQGPDGAVYLLEDGEAPGRGRLLRLEPAQ